MYRLCLTKLTYPDFKGCCLWRNAPGHEISMAYPDPHAWNEPVEVHWTAKAVKNKSILRYIEADDGKWVSVADGGKAAILSVNFQDGTSGDIGLWRTYIAIIWKEIVHGVTSIYVIK